jgi:hypothetical protein
MKKRILYLPMSIKCSLTLYYGNNSDEIVAMADKLNAILPGNKQEGANGLFIKAGTSFYILFHKYTTEGELAHEFTHFMNTWFDSINQKLDPMNDELYCHVLGHYIDQGLKFKRQCEKE